MQKHYQYLLFDWDGCLAQTLQIHLKAYQETFAEYGVQPTVEEITQKVFGDWNGPAHIGIQDVAGFTEKYLARVNQTYVQAPLYPHVFSTIQALSQNGKSLALVSSSTNRLSLPALEHHNITSFFKVILTAEDVTEHKPAPEIIDKALQRLGGNKAEAVIIGDSKSDLGAAQNAGIDAILFYPDDHTIFYNREKLLDYKPKAVIQAHRELLELLG